MRRFPIRTALAAAVLATGLSAAPAVAQESDGDPAFLTFGAGIVNITEDDVYGDFRLEYRHDERFFYVKPMVGIQGFSDGSFYGYAGFNIDLYFGNRWVLSPNFGVGGYSGEELKLGNELEFRSGLELAYRFDDRSRLGIHFSHISNANIGEKNPGTESLVINYSLPLPGFFAK